MAKTLLKESYLGGKTPKALKNEVYKFREMYDDKDTRVMFNQSVNKFYTRLVFKIDALPQDMVFPLDIAVTLLNNFCPGVRKFLISEGVQVSPRPPTETNH